MLVEISEYERITTQWNVKSRYTLETTLSWISRKSPKITAKLQHVLDGMPIVKPASYNYGTDSDFFELSFSTNDIDEIMMALIEMSTEAVTYHEDISEFEIHMKNRDASRLLELVLAWKYEKIGLW